MMLNCQFRLSHRVWFGDEPNKDTMICDDVMVVGSYSIEHRIRKALFYFSSKEAKIFGFQFEYMKDDKKNTVAGQW